jgi:hypothetical protein
VSDASRHFPAAVIIQCLVSKEEIKAINFGRIEIGQSSLTPHVSTIGTSVSIILVRMLQLNSWL